jgi:Ser/Thr protein kinase RdoA (MazF antagonist)
MSVMSLGEPIAGTGNLYTWGESQILKLYGDDAPAGWVEHIGKVERALYEAGLPVPAVGEIIEVDGHLGQVYERIGGGSMAEDLLAATELDSDRIARLAHAFAEVHAKIHTYGNIPELPSQRQLLPTIIRRITALPPDLKEATLKALDEMPEGDRLCHGDFHPYNVLMSPRGPIVIDWNNAHIGNPLEDVARSTLILSGVPVSQPSYQALIEQFDRAYLERYFELRPGDQEQLVAWQPIVAAVRLSDSIPEIQEWLLEHIRMGLALQG